MGVTATHHPEGDWHQQVGMFPLHWLHREARNRLYTENWSIPITGSWDMYTESQWARILGSMTRDVKRALERGIEVDLPLPIESRAPSLVRDGRGTHSADSISIEHVASKRPRHTIASGDGDEIKSGTIDLLASERLNGALADFTTEARRLKALLCYTTELEEIYGRPDRLVAG